MIPQHSWETVHEGASVYSDTGRGEGAERLRSALRDAARRLRVDIRPGREAWGYGGRTLGVPADGPEGPRWLRLLCVPAVMGRRDFWEGALRAQEAVPDTILRPRIFDVCDWSDGEHYFRGELFEEVRHAPAARDEACIRAVPDVDEAWWDGIVAVVDVMPTVPTDRVTVRQGYLDWAMPAYLGLPVDSRVPAWTTSHGDLHWANVTVGRPYVLDWERWGVAPAGWDAAVLHTYSLLVPSVAAQVRQRLGHVMNTPEGRFAELAVIAEVLHFAVDRDVLPDLREPMRRRAAAVIALV